MAETQNAKMSETLNETPDKSIMENGSESIDDSGIELSEEKDKVESNPTMNCPWILGQLAWARGSSYPFWPCVVTLDPKTMQYFKIQNKGRSQALVIHVQYFGDGGRHNWVLSHHMIPFSGLEEFHNQAKAVTLEAKKKDPKLAAAFSPKLGVKKQWGIGITEASGLMHLSNEERASIFEPVPLPPEKTTPQTNNKLKRKLSTRGSKNSSEAPTPVPKRFKENENEDQAEELTSSSKPVSVTKLETGSVASESTSAVEEELSKESTTASRRKSTRNQSKGLKETDVPKRQYTRRKAKLSEEEKSRRDELDFEDYYNLNKEFWKADYPESTDEEVKKLLREMWDGMDAEEKSNNLNRNFDEYRYNSTTDQPEVKRMQKKTTLNGKENLKNTENAKQESNKNVSKLNGKNEKDSVKKNSEDNKGKDVFQSNGSPLKEKSKEALKVNGSSQKEKIEEIPDVNNSFQKEENGGTLEVDGSSQKEKNREILEEKNGEILEVNGSSLKGKGEKILEVNGSSQEEKVEAIPHPQNEAQKNERVENSKTDAVPQNGDGKDTEMKIDSQDEDPKESFEEEKVGEKSSEEDGGEKSESCLENEKSAPKDIENATETEAKASEVDKINDVLRMEVDKAEKIDKNESGANAPEEKA